MATAKKEGGLYYLADGTAVDANGEAVKGAPKRKPDTDPSKQPGALNAPTSEERMGFAIAQALANPQAMIAKVQAAEAAAAKTDDEEDEGVDTDESDDLPKLDEMPEYLATMTDVDELKALKKQDKRKGGKELIQARIDALKTAE